MFLLGGGGQWSAAIWPGLGSIGVWPHACSRPSSHMDTLGLIILCSKWTWVKLTAAQHGSFQRSRCLTPCVTQTSGTLLAWCELLTFLSLQVTATPPQSPVQRIKHDWQQGSKGIRTNQITAEFLAVEQDKPREASTASLLFFFLTLPSVFTETEAVKCLAFLLISHNRVHFSDFHNSGLQLETILPNTYSTASMVFIYQPFQHYFQ